MRKKTKPKVFQELLRTGTRIFSISLLLLVVQIVAHSPAQGQDTGQRVISLNLKDVSVLQALNEVNQASGDMVIFRKEIVEKETKRVTLKADNILVFDAVKSILEGTKLMCTRQSSGKILVGPKPDEGKEASLSVSGRVLDEKGNPIPGASVVIYGTTNGVATDVDGHYTLKVRPTDVLQFSFVGYKTEIVPVEGKKSISIELRSTSENLEEVAVVAFGEQKKESVVSAITTVRAMDLKTSSSDLTANLAGRVAGIIGWQTGGLPGVMTEEEMNTKFYVRGITSFNTTANRDPLILIDGVESSKLDLSRMAPEDIETFSVMKDASATAMYGARGANGVIIVTTKKGEEGSVYTTARYEVIFSTPTKEIDVVDPVTYMRMYNQAWLGRSEAGTPLYSAERINRTGSPNYPSWVYPANDWYDILFKDYNVNHHAGLNIRGGSKIVQYYASLNYNRDLGMLKTDRLNDFDVNIISNQTQLRLNLNVDLKAGIKFVFTTVNQFDKYHGPTINAQTAYAYAFNASPVDFAPMYPADDTYNWPHLRFGGTEAGQTNPYASLQAGYIEQFRYSSQTRGEYIQNLSGLIKGLELRASVSMSLSGLYYTSYNTTPAQYALQSYNFETGKHVLQALNEEDARRTLLVGTNSSTSKRSVTYTAQLLHTAAWADHQTSVTGVFQMQESNSTPVSTVLTGMPNRNLTFSMRASYGYKDRYFIEGSFGYNGSERFAKKNKMGFFPAGGVAWVVSSEPFMSSVTKWLPFLKFRASYGRVGNDGIIEEPRFVYLPLIGTTTAEGFNPEAFSQKSTYYRYMIQAYENPDIQWEIAEQINLGLEGKMFDGIFEFTFDAFQETRHNIIGNRTVIPPSMGIEVAPLDNIGKARTRGIEFSGKIQHAFSPDVWMILNGNVTYSKSTYLEIEEATDRPDWQGRVGQEISQQLGYIAEGLFQDQVEIDNSPFQSGDVMPGDIRYRDINNDGVIDVEDATFIGYPETPRLIYGFQGYFNFKDWEFNFAFQGSGNRGFFMNPEALSPFVNDHAMLKAIYEDHWSEDNMASHPFWPRLSTRNITEHNPEEDWYSSSEVRKSTYFMRECTFLRCTQLELAYNMPRKLMTKWKMQNVKFFARVNNPFLISNFKVWDVELGEDGFNYPIQRTYSIGLNFSF